MIRFERKPPPWIYITIVLSMTGVFFIDLITPLGYAEWIVYILPVTLSLFTWLPSLPLTTAFLATVFLVVGYYVSPAEIDPKIAILNRSLGFVVLWVVAGICNYAVRRRLWVRRQDWLQKGQTQLSECMGGELRLEELGNNILQCLAEYLQFTAGAIFAADGRDYRRVGTYAVPDDAAIPERIKRGQGLLGQAVIDVRAFYIDNVPEGYLSFGSSLGSARPSHLAIFPVIVDGNVNAVAELAFLHPIYESDRELFRLIGPSIGVAIRSAIYRSRLQDLLEETQRQGEELQAQSEELRVSNEELTEQGRVLKESQARLEQQQAELEQTNSQLEEQTQILESQKDDLNRTKISLEAQARDLERASQYKSEFLANMSHELRTPLNSSLILAKLLADNREGNLTAEQVKFAQTIHDAGNDLLTLINDILDLSKIEAGRLEVRPVQLRLASLVEGLDSTFQPVAVNKGLKFIARIDSDAPPVVRTDPQRLEQILRNLLANAMKFTEQGEVTLEIRAVPGGRIEFIVRDTGIGIAADQQEVIFEAFRQADGTTNRKYGGTGLGLSISRELSRLLGGDIRLASEIGQGSTFVLTIPQTYDESSVPRPAQRTPASTNVSEHPAQPAPPAKPPEPARSRPAVRRMAVADDREKLDGNGRVILIVEDDEPFARILYDLGHELGFQCLIATTAEEGLALAVQYVPSAVVLDVGLPDQSGLSVLDRLKRDVRTRHVPVHVVSAADYAETALALGAVGYMLKPVKREQLVQAFEGLETRLAQRLRRVLIVEDDLTQLESLRHLLGSSDVQTLGVSSVGECLEQLKSSTFDCMVLDLSLSDASGFALLETLSHEDRYAFPPVIVYTGRDLTIDEEQKLRRYSKSIIIKGAKSPERLLDEVTLFLHQVVTELPPAHQEMLKKVHSRETALEGRRVMIVEDDVRNVFALTSILEPRGVNVRIARNGREAIETLEKTQHDPAQAIDLVLMDLMMPEMDGLTAMREIRKHPGWDRLPIIALTAKAMKSDQQQCLEAGANDYMAKPLDVEKLLSLVRVWMPR